MQRAVLTHENERIYADYLMVRQLPSQSLKHDFIVVIIIRRHDDGAVYKDKIRIRAPKPLVAVKFSLRKR